MGGIKALASGSKAQQPQSAAGNSDTSSVTTSVVPPSPRGEGFGAVQQTRATQETAAEPAPWSPEWIKETVELGRGVETRKKQQQQADVQMLREVIDEVLGVNTPADPVNIDTSSITLGMTDEQRAAVLTGKAITPVTNTNSANYAEELSTIKSFPAKAKSKVEKTIKALAVKLGILNKSLQTPDVEVDFQFSNGGLSKSLSQQLKYGGSYADFAGAISNLEQILQNAVLIEQHNDKYAGTSRADRTLERVYVLFGAYQDETSIIPVQMEIKKSSTGGGRLYVTVAMTKIEADVRGSTDGQSQAHSLISASKYSLSEIFEKINPADKHFLKYLPDNFLSEEQKTAKQIALQEDADKIAKYKPRDVQTTHRETASPDANSSVEAGSSVGAEPSIYEKVMETIALGQGKDTAQIVDTETQAEYDNGTDAITDDEKVALLAYKSGGSYQLNAKLREGIELDEQQQAIVDGLDSALPKLPVYTGTVYRNLVFDDFGGDEARAAFLNEHAAGNIISYDAYTSASTEIDGYPVEGNFAVHMIIESADGRNMAGYGNNFESEVLFARNTYIEINRI